MKKPLLLVLVVFGLTACSTRFAYNNLDWLIHWYVDDYIALNQWQKQTFNLNMEQWLEWHRQQELDQYRNHLLELDSDFKSQPMTEERWHHHFDRGQHHWLRLRDKVLPELASLAKALEDDQVNSLFEAMERDNLNLQDKYGETDPQDAITKRTKQISKNLRQWLGRLTDEQRSLINDFAPQFIANNNLWLEHRRELQKQARALLASRTTDPDFETKLIHLLQHPKTIANPVYVENGQANRNTYARLLATLWPTITAKQKARLEGEIQDYLKDIRILQES
ncbi:MAG: hypothetical protein AseanaTS_25000 [Candidatus Pelagadaptatus aseana]|uniref:DUF6279 family lipoprotein n=1 Tax=Candidatus Pelagadaptatus aseana TaxID=3120508 RepID=UPI0039B2EED1